MRSAISLRRPLLGDLWWIFNPTKTERDTAARPSDGLVVFSVMWGMAMMLSIASQVPSLRGDYGILLVGMSWAVLGAGALLVMNPRKTRLLIVVSGLMLAQYALRMPVSGNNQMIAAFMNIAIVIAVTGQAVRDRGQTLDREVPYEQLRVVARSLLAIMYFYGIFHKINWGFFDPDYSCATALYVPLAQPFGLDESIVGRYLSIISTFVVEAIALVCLYWRRYFWVGLLVSLPFHYVIPISGFSWYMDFSSLVFALYMLSAPREAASGLYSTGAWLVRRVPQLRAGTSAIVALAAFWGLAAAIMIAVYYFLYPDRQLKLVWHSIWLLLWAAFGGVAMLFIIRAALLEHPYADQARRVWHGWWVYAVPATLFLLSASPYVGLKTESSIAMFSNLHTEGGVSNHLLFPKPPYLFDYQAGVARIIDTNNQTLKDRALANPNFGLVEHDVAIRLMGTPGMWVTYQMNGRVYERVTLDTFPGDKPSWLERKILDFKPIDWTRPKPCTH